MKSFLATVLILGFSGIAIFGFSAMGHNDGSHKGCLAATSQGIVCPNAMSALDFASFHLNTFRDLTTATLVGGNILSILLLATTLSLLAISIIGNGPALPALVPITRKRFASENLYHSQQKLARWFSLHENSPSAF